MSQVNHRNQQMDRHFILMVMGKKAPKGCCLERQAVPRHRQERAWWGSSYCAPLSLAIIMLFHKSPGHSSARGCQIKQPRPNNRNCPPLASACRVGESAQTMYPVPGFRSPRVKAVSSAIGSRTEYIAAEPMPMDSV